MKIKIIIVFIGIIGVLIFGVGLGLILGFQSPVKTQSSANASGFTPVGIEGTDVTGNLQQYLLYSTGPSNVTSLPIYTVVTKNLSEDGIRLLAQKLGVKGPIRVSQVGDETNYDISTQDTSSGSSYGFSFRNPSNKRVGFLSWDNFTEEYLNHDPTLLPADKEADKIAHNFLKSHNLDFPGAVVGSIDHEPSTVYWPLNNTTEIISDDILVSYSHVIDGYEVPGDRLNIRIGENGNIISLVANWNSFVKSGNVPVITPQEALQKLQGQKIILENADTVTGPASINSFKIIYHYPDPNVPSGTIVPYYYFQGDIQGTKYNRVNWYQLVPAEASG